MYSSKPSMMNKRNKHTRSNWPFSVKSVSLHPRMLGRPAASVKVVKSIGTRKNKKKQLALRSYVFFLLFE
jgi:hypothetical protein